jgi:hypothetical protein
MAQHIQPVGFVNVHRLHRVPLGERVGEIHQGAIDAGHHDFRVVAEELGGGCGGDSARGTGYGDAHSWVFYGRHASP